MTPAMGTLNRATQELGLLVARVEGAIDAFRESGDGDCADILAEAVKEPKAAYEAARDKIYKEPTP